MKDLTGINAQWSMRENSDATVDQRLIDAAPDLLAAGRRIVNLYGEDCGDHCSNACAVCQMRAAIAKAEAE